MSYYLGVLVATLLTLVIFSRVWRVNRGYQAAQYLLLGALAGYVAAVLLRNTLIPFFLGQLRGGFAGWIMVVLTLFLILLLALRFTRRSSWRVAGLIPLSLLMGTMSALALAGALRGTLVPQIMAGIDLHFFAAAPWLDTIMVVLAMIITISVLFYFQHRTHPPQEKTPGWMMALVKFGYWGVMIAAGALLATTAGARLTLLIDRIYFLGEIWGQWLSGR